MNNFLIIANADKDGELKLTNKIMDYLNAKGCKCQYTLTKLLDNDIVTDEKMAKADCVIVIGGDGTMLHGARVALKSDTPVIGINLGNVGYLCELESEHLEESLDALVEDRYTIENRMMLHGDVCTQNGEKFQDMALNDIVIHRGGTFKVLDFIIYVNGEHLYTYAADGIILSTPTGSTGYSMSAGGPIVEPNAELIVLTPINPHLLTRKSIILSANDEVVIEVGAGRRQSIEEAEVTFDGRKSFALKSGDKIKVSRSKDAAKFVNINKISFLKNLGKKMRNYS